MTALKLRVLCWIAAALILALVGCATVQEQPGPAEERSLSGQSAVVITHQRAGAGQPFLLLLAPQPRAAVVLLTGGDGLIDLDPQTGNIGRPGNFLLRTRHLFVQNGLTVAVTAPPTDRSSLRDFRTTQGHVLDLKGVIAYLRGRLHVPVWLVGTSRGTISAAVAAGAVLTSTVTEATNRQHDSVHSAELASIRIPTLLVHHRQDACFVTPVTGAQKLLDDLPNAPVKELIVIEGGGPPRGPPCEPHHFHGFEGREAETVKIIADWIKAHA